MGGCCKSNYQGNVITPQRNRKTKMSLKQLKQNYEFDHQDQSNPQILGQGGFGKVFLSNNKHNPDQKVAIKVMSKAKLQSRGQLDIVQ